jgi:glyoxylase-like metal-dependent hydrolase (beta-lactamase superfamily II)
LANIVFSLEVLPAMQGDCMLLRYGPKANNKQKLALIDAGPSGVYAKHLKPRLMKLRAEKGVPDEEPMVLDWVMVSHVDDDHVNGLVQLTEELKALPANRFVKPARLWHNCFDDVIGNDATELRKAARTFGTASLTGDISLDAVPAEAQVDAATFADALMVLAGIGQGVDLRDNAKVLEIPVNADGKGGLTVARADGKPIDMGGGLTFIVIGPMLDEVKALQEEHRKWLEEQKKKPKPPAGALAAYIDPSVTNLSSIVVLAELGGKKILFTGDARGDKILGGMKHVGLGDRLHVDVLKSQHHGSDNNATQDFFERVTADHYVFSGNGGHGNPERETFDMLRKARPGASYSIYLTYEIDAIDVLREKDWEQKRKARQRRGNEPGPAWSAAKQGLAAFFKKHPDMKNRVVPLKGDVPRHRIDLLERL